MLDWLIALDTMEFSLLNPSRELRITPGYSLSTVAIDEIWEPGRFAISTVLYCTYCSVR